MRIERVAQADCDALELAENCFTSSEVFDIELLNGKVTLDLRAVAPFTKSYAGDEAADDDDEIYGAFVNDALVGKIVLAPTWNALASIEHIVVARASRKLGIASQLIDFAKQWAHRNQLKGVRLETQTNNVPACRLYLRHGFEVGGFDRFAYSTQAHLAHETALYMYWFPDR